MSSPPADGPPQPAPDTPVTVLHIALDRLGAIQSEFGEWITGQVLRLAATRLQDICGPDAPIAKTADHAFLVLVQGGAEHCEPLARLMVASVAQAFAMLGHRPRSCCSVGIAVYPYLGPRADIFFLVAQALQGAQQHAARSVSCSNAPATASLTLRS